MGDKPIPDKEVVLFGILLNFECRTPEGSGLQLLFAMSNKRNSLSLKSPRGGLQVVGTGVDSGAGHGELRSAGRSSSSVGFNSSISLK